MDFRQVTNSRFGVGTALGLGRILPQGVGYPLARWIANRIANRKDVRMVKAVKANQWVVSDGQLSAAQLDEMARRVFRNIARSQYDLYHNLTSEQGLIKKIELTSETEQDIEKIKDRGAGGILIVCPHLSNFDLMGRALAIRGINFQALSPPEPPGGYQMQNYLRRKAGIEMTPISVAALRQATQRLQQGGVVITGVDRPIAGEKYRPRFFGRRASLPVGHIRLALKAEVPLRVVACQTVPGCKYRLILSDPVPMRRYPDLIDETEKNAEAVLAIVEQWIKQSPEQWAMTYPVWPEALEEMEMQGLL